MNLRTLLQLFIIQNQYIKDFLRIMRMSLFLLFVCTIQLLAVNAKAQNTIIKLDTDVLSIGQLINQIEKQTDYLVVFRNQEVNTNRTVSLHKKSGKIGSYLDEAFKNTDIVYEIDNKYILLYRKSKETERMALAQQAGKKVTGVVLDQNGEPIIGANVIEKGTINGVVTGVDGDFILNVSSNAILTVSFIGYDIQEFPVGKKDQFTIRLKESSEMLSEVVVTALGIKRSEKALGYAVQKVGSEELTGVKGVNIATSLSGKIAGVTVINTNAFNEAPSILLRGESPLIVIDGVPFENTGLGQLSADDIESMNVLKGATASALYGSKGSSGAIMITTKRAKKEGLAVSVNSNTMFNTGYLMLPEVQSSYSSGSGGKYLQDLSEYIWGDKLDIGRTAVQYDPYTYEWREMPLVSKGKNNFKNLLETSLVTNNNVNIAYKGEKGGFRTSLTHVYNKGQFPGNKLNKLNYTVAGEMKVGKFSMDASISYNMSYTPQYRGEGYGRTGYLYNMVVWTGPDYDVREFRNYWKKGKEDIEQNWHYKYDYNNPYFIAYEMTQSDLQNRVNAQVTANYEIKDWLKATARVGSDTYSRKYDHETPLSARDSQIGAFAKYLRRGVSVTGDAILMADKKLGDFNVDGLFGASLYYYQNDNFDAYTNGGLIVPGFYSLKASKDLPSVSTTVSNKQINSFYGKVGLSWRNAIFVEATGRNDWVSTLAKSESSYFYPSVSGSLILSDLVDLSRWVSFLKLRTSWTVIKTPASIYEINKVYTVTQNVWDGLSSAENPTSMRDVTLRPEKETAFEAGLAVNVLNNRLRFDVAYYTKLFTDIHRNAPLSYASGFGSTLINYAEERIKKGWEITLTGDVLKSKTWNWTSSFNWGRDRYYYHKIDEAYSTDRPWVVSGERWDWFEVYDWARDSEGNIIHSGGMPVVSDYPTHAGFERPDWVWGFTNHLSYKNFTLDVSFDGRVGGRAHNRLEQALWNSGVHVDSDNQWRYDEVVNGKTNYIGQGVKVVSGSVEYDSYGNILNDTREFAPNDVPVSYEAYTKIYHPWNGNKRIQNIHDLTFLKLRELSIGYKIPSQIVQKAGLENVHVSLVGQNLFIWSKAFKYSDPDAITEGYAEELNAPSMRYLGFNVKFDF